MEPTSLIVDELKSNGIPVCVLKNGSDEDCLNVGLAIKDEVVFSNISEVAGLERRVVIGETNTFQFCSFVLLLFF